MGLGAQGTAMELLIYVVVYVIAIALGTAILVGSLFLVEDIRASSFKEFGALGTLARCVGIVVVTTLLGLLPFGALLALVVWFIGIMALFQKPIGQTLILFVVNVVFWFGVSGAIGYLLS